MKQALKCFGIFFGIVCFLSITIKNETIFSYIYGVISPATTLTQKGVIAAYDYSAEKTRDLAKKLFDNSVPRSDSVRAKYAAPSRRGKSGAPAEEISPAEREELDDLIKDHR